MKIKKIDINNFRGIEVLSLKLTDPEGQTPNLIVLAGPNGCGKTSILEACLLALGKDDLLQARKDTKDNVRKGAKDYDIRLTIDHVGQEYEIIRISKNGRPMHDQNLRALKDLPVEYFSSWRYPKLVGSVSITAGKKGRRPDQNEENRLWRLKQYLVNLTATKAFEKDNWNTFSEQEQEAYEKINRIWRFFYPQNKETFIAKRASEDVSEGFDLFLEGRGQEAIPMDALSSGEIEILTLLGQSLKNSYKQGIIFLDEPELHLHPAWHRVILQVLRKIWPETQIFCATHSTEILDSAFSYERFTLLDENDPRIRLIIPEQSNQEVTE